MTQAVSRIEQLQYIVDNRDRSPFFRYLTPEQIQRWAERRSDPFIAGVYSRINAMTPTLDILS